MEKKKAMLFVSEIGLEILASSPKWQLMGLFKNVKNYFIKY
jgi:hypothetical protein